MEKEKSLCEAFEKIEVPKEDVLAAISIGRERASKKSAKTKKRVKRIVFTGVAASIILVSSTFISPSFANVMADVPLLGKVYEDFNDAIGRNLQSKNLITALNEKASNEGIDISITDSYFDGGVVGVTFKVQGKVNKDDNGTLVGVYEIFDGNKSISDSKELVFMEPTDGGYIGHIQLDYPKEKLPKDTTFPLEFTSIGHKEGSWKFDVPIKQLPVETIKINKESGDEFSEVNVHFDTFIFGKASTAINYTATFPVQGIHDQVRLEIFDNRGNEIPIKSDGIDLQTIKEKDKIIVKGRSIISQPLKDKTNYLEIHPKVDVTQEDKYIALESTTPIEATSDRQDLSVKVEEINVKKDKLIVDIQMNKGNEMIRDAPFYKEFARNGVELIKKSEKHIYKKSFTNTVKTINKDELRYRITYHIGNLKEFEFNKYLLRINLNSLSSNIPVELQKLKVRIK